MCIVLDLPRNNKSVEKGLQVRTIPYSEQQLKETGIRVSFNVAKHRHDGSQKVFIRTIEVGNTALVLKLSEFDTNGKTNRFVFRHGCEKIAWLWFDKKLSNLFVQKVLQKPVILDNIQYNFIGCSSNGLKDRH